MFATSSYGTLIYKDIARYDGHAGRRRGEYSHSCGEIPCMSLATVAERQAAAQFLTFLTSAEANADWAMIPAYAHVMQRVRHCRFQCDFDNYKVAVDASTMSFSTRSAQRTGSNIIMEAYEAVLLERRMPQPHWHCQSGTDRSACE
jgi:hypothetical protein